jgi:hypothetical protein
VGGSVAFQIIIIKLSRSTTYGMNSYFDDKLSWDRNFVANEVEFENREQENLLRVNE